MQYYVSTATMITQKHQLLRYTYTAYLCLPAFRFSPVGIIPPIPHAHRLIYNRHYVTSAIDIVFK